MHMYMNSGLGRAPLKILIGESDARRLGSSRQIIGIVSDFEIEQGPVWAVNRKREFCPQCAQDRF